jgi:drug/metabolite transporter (DMT)-like permease
LDRKNEARDHLSIFDGLKMVFVAFLWALCFPLIKLGLASGTPPILFGALRSAIAALGLLIIARSRKEPFSPVKDHTVLLFFIGVAAFFGYGGMFIGGSSVNPGLASVIGNSNPIMASVLAVLLLSESVTVLKVAGLVLGFIGVVLISIPSFSGESANSLTGIGFILGAALGTAFGNVLLKKISNSDFPILALTIQFAFAALLLIPLSIVMEGSPIIKWSANFSISLLALSLGASALADVLWIDLLRKNSLSKLNIFIFLTPAFSIGIGITFFNEAFGIWEKLGVSSILLGAALNIVRVSKRPIIFRGTRRKINT